MNTISFMIGLLPSLLPSIGITLAIALGSATIGSCLGTVLALIYSSKIRIAQWAVIAYVTIIRGTPMLLQIMFLYLALPTFGIHISAFLTAVVAIGLNSGAYVSQIMRAGISSVSHGQVEAAHTLGIRQRDITRYIVLPQALRVVLPALGNEMITLVKDSSLASLIGVVELYMKSSIIINQTYKALPVYITIGIIYLIITSILSLIVHFIERKLNHARN